jgi:hypothetical protein
MIDQLVLIAKRMMQCSIQKRYNANPNTPPCNVLPLVILTPEVLEQLSKIERERVVV